MKTLGIKFEVAGVSEAQAGLNSLRSGLNSALTQNKKAIADYQREQSRSWREWKIENFGTLSQRQNLTIRQDKRELTERSTYKDLSVNNRALVLEFRLAYKDFFGQLETLLEELKPEKTGFTDMLGSLITTPLKFAFDALLFPFQSMVSGAFERLGEVQVQDFAEGFNKNLQRALGLSFEETGGDVGNVIGKSLYKVYQKSIDSVDQYVKGTLQFDLADTLIDAFKHTVKTLAKELPALALRTHRRIQINKSAIPEARRAAGRRIIDNDLPEATRKDIEQNKSITLVYGGANTDPSDIGKDYMARVMKPYLKGSAVIPVARQWTNSAVDSEFQGDMKNLIKLIISNPVTAQTFKSFVSENGLKNLGAVEQKELVDGLDLGGAIDLSSLDRIAEIIQSLLGNKDFALGKALQATFNGYNPDDVLGAAEAIALMEQFPEKDLQIGGFSHGGYNALGTVDLLNRMGYDKVKGFSIGTPITGANATVNPDNFRSFMGDEDYYYKALTGLAGDEIDFPEFFELGKKEGAMHSLQGYVRGDDLKGGLQAFLGDRVSLPSKDKYGKHDSSYGYAVGELGAETALVRTLLTYLGESQLGTVKAKEGFVFSAEETLPGYTANIKKLGQGLKDEDTKKFHVEYIDFLETLQQELEIAEQLAAIGKKYKPLKSLEKAAKIFPTMEGLVKKHDPSFDSSKQSIFEFENQRKSSAVEFEAAKREAQEKAKYVFFQRKVKQQKDNIERTFQAMLGRKFSAKDEAKGIYSFYNSEEYDERAGNFEGMVNWLENDILGGASDGEKEQAQPTLELLKKITQSIRETGSTGQFDLSTARSAEKLLGIDLKEFNLLFKEFEGNNKQKIDVNRYQDELTTARRNRDQILNEKKTPVEVAKSLSEARNKITTVDTTEPVELNTSQLQSAFSDYLAEIIRKGTEYGTQFLRDNANQIKPENFNEAEVTKSFNELNTQFKSATSEYRKAVASGNNELATQLAEDLLFQSGSLKRIYGELIGQIQNEDTAKSIRGFSGYLTSVQTEVIQGQPNLKGRADRGLPDLIPNDPAFEEQVRQIDFGIDIRAGVEKIINRETGEEIGYQFVLGINQGGQNAADINSPSRVWEWIGEMISAGFNGGVAGIGDFLVQSMQGAGDSAVETVRNVVDSVSNVAQELDNSRGLLDPLFETEGADDSVNDFFGNLIQKVSDTFDDLKSKYPVLGRIVDVIGSIGGEVLQVLGIFSLGESLINFSATALDTAMKMESLERSIISVSNSAADGARNINFVRNEAKRLSIDLTTAAEAYKRIVGATKNTPLEGLQTEQLFTTLATTARNRGLNTDATNRLFLGFEQVIAKGGFKSEEVRGQLSEVMGDIQPLLASAVGAPVSSLSDLMESDSLKAPEVMPKLMALLDAQNAALGDGASTAQAAQTRLNNAILEFQDAVGRQLQPVQKMGLDSLASALEVLQQYSQVSIKLVNGLVTTMLVNLTLKLLATKLAVNGVVIGLGRLIGLMLSAPFLAFAGKFLLISAAIEVWSNNIKLAQNAFPELQDRIEASTRRLDALRRAFDDTGFAAKEFEKNQPKQLQLNEGAKVPAWLQGIAGGERFNLDNFYRNRMQKLYGGKGGKFLRYGPLGVFMRDGGGTTQAQKKQADFVAGSGDLISKSDQTLTYSDEARKVLDKIATIDAKARDLQSQRINILPGDSEGLNKALKAEQAVLAERDKLLQKSASYSESLQGDIQDIKDTLLDLDKLNETGGTQSEIDQRENTRKTLEERLEGLEKEKKAIDEINGRIPKFLSQVNRLLRNSGERVKGFIGSQEDNAVVNRNQIIEQALANGLSDAQLEVKLDNLSTTDLKDRISFVNQEIKSLEDKLSNQYLKEGVAGLERAAKLEAEQDGKSYLGLTSDVLTRMAGEGRSSAETEAANILLALDEYQGILAESQSGLLDSIKTSQSTLKDFNKTIADYFYRLTQQIKEATLETQRLISDIFYTDVKNKLLGALAPGSNTFVNGIIDNVQSIVDQAGQVAQKIFGDSAAQLGFESETRTLATEMQDFLKEVKGASEALDEFARKLKEGVDPSRFEGGANPTGDGQGVSSGTNSTSNTTNQSSNFVTKTKDIANRLGIDPHALMTIMLFESAGTLSPKIQGPEVKNQGRGRGLIQFMPATARGLGTSDSALASMTDVQQLDWVEKYFAQFKGNFAGGKLENLYAAVLAGDPRRVNASDGYTTARQGAVRMMREHGDKAASLLGQKDVFVASTPNNTASEIRTDPVIEAQAVESNRQLVAAKAQNLELTKEQTQQLRESLEIEVKNKIELNRRQGKQGRQESNAAVLGVEDKIFGFKNQYGYQSATAELTNNLRSLKQQFLDADLDIASQITNTEDAILSITNSIPVLTEQIAKFKEIGTPEALAAASVQQSALDELTLTLPTMKGNLLKLQSFQAQTPGLQQQSEYFLRDQGIFKTEQEQLTKANSILSQKATLTEARGTLEEKRQVRLEQEDLRLELDIKDIQLNTPEGIERNTKILNAQRQSKVNKENIDYDAQLEELDIERKLLDYQTGIGDKKAGFYSRFSLNFGAEKLKKENAIAQEKLRFERELIELEKQYNFGEPEKLNRLTQAARELNSVNLLSIEREFKSLGSTVEDYFGSAAQGFFTQFTTNFFDGKAQSDRALLEERLRYAEEVVGLENSNRDTPGKLAHLKNRARELNEEKLDKIRGEFNLFSRTIDLARGALLEFVKQLAQLAAQQAASKFISSILGSILGGVGGKAAKVGNDYGSGAGTFTASEGITVGDEIENYNRGGSIKKRKLSDRLSKMMVRNAPGVKKAWRSEGSDAQLGVFHTGEELLSRKTGEAGRYQALKYKLGINPLAKITNYAAGGTIPEVGSSVLSGFSSSRPRIDLSGLDNGRQKSKGYSNKTINLQQTIYTDSADSFRLNEDQRNQDLIERLRRGI